MSPEFSQNLQEKGFNMRSRLLAAAGIVILVLSFLSTGEKSPVEPAMPFVLILFSRVAMLAFVTTATVFLWKRARTLAKVFAGVNVLLVLAVVPAITRVTMETIPMTLVHAPMMAPGMDTRYGIPIYIAWSIVRVTGLVLDVWVIVKLFFAAAPRRATSGELPTPDAK
jgi:hypothetical protein